MKKVTLKKDLPGCPAGAEGKWNSETEEWEFLIELIDDEEEVHCYSEVDLTNYSDFFEITEETEKIQVGSLVRITNLEGGKWNGEIGEIGKVRRIINRDDRVWIKCENPLFGGEHPIECFELVTKLEPLCIDGYESTVHDDEIRFGCNGHTVENLKSYFHFLSINKRAHMMLGDNKITKQMIHHLLLFHSLNK